MNTTQEYAEINALLRQPETGGSLDELSEKLCNNPLSASDQLELLLLLQALGDDNDGYFEGLLRQGNSDDASEIFNLLVHLFQQERAKVRSHANTPGTADQSKYCLVAQRVVRLVSDVVMELAEDEDVKRPNVLHLVAQHGTPRIAGVIIEAVRTLDEDAVGEMLRQPDTNAKTPLGIALYHDNDAMAAFLVDQEGHVISKESETGQLHDPDLFKRRDHVVCVVEKGNLKYLKMLLANHERESLLTIATLEVAVRSGNVNIWKFIVNWNSDLSKDHGLLFAAIRARRPEIVRLILEAHPTLLENLDKAKEAACLAVDMAEKKKDEKEFRAPKKAQANGDVKTKLALNFEEKQRGDKKSSNDSSKAKVNEGMPSNFKERATVPTERKRESKSKLNLSGEIKDILLEHMVRHLPPRQVQCCWPRPKGQASKEAYLELNVSSRNWTWFVQFVHTAHEDLKVIEILTRREVEAERKRNEEAERSILEQAQQQAGQKVGEKTLPQQHHVPPKTAPQPSKQKDPYEGLTVANYTSKYKVNFQPYLKYVSFPNLETIRKQNYAYTIQDLFGQEVKYVLQWLRIVKGVTRILDLRVLDSRHEPHSEETIEDAVEGLEVEELNWKRMDLSVHTVLRTAKDVRILHLYSSGSWTPLSHWMGPDGLNALSAREVHVEIIKDAITENRATDQETKLRDWLDTYWKPLASASNSKQSLLKSTVVSSPWVTAGLANPSDPEGDTTRDAKTIVKLKNFIAMYVAAHARAMAVPATERTIRRIKVCIIDTGIDESRFKLEAGATVSSQRSTWRRNRMRKNIATQGKNETEGEGEEDEEKKPRIVGATFSQTGDSHWWLSGDSHGTQMAKLVTNLDPCCSIYVAKIGDSKSDISTGAVIEALKWAIDEGVDVISMSFALDCNTPNLEAEVNRALTEGIVMVCSTADEGRNQPEAWPAANSQTMAIGACDESGVPIHASSTVVDYFLLGEKVLYDSAQGLEFREEISGSSVATAIAAGIASLCLSCWQIDDHVNFAEQTVRYNRRDQVKTRFDAMKGNNKQDKSKYVRPWVVFGDKDRGVGEKMFL